MKYLYEYEINYNKPITYKNTDYLINKKLKKYIEQINISNHEIEILKKDVVEMFKKIYLLILNKNLIKKY